jgi:hypothetical protein
MADIGERDIQAARNRLREARKAIDLANEAKTDAEKVVRDAERVIAGDKTFDLLETTHRDLQVALKEQTDAQQAEARARRRTSEANQDVQHKQRIYNAELVKSRTTAATRAA